MVTSFMVVQTSGGPTPKVIVVNLIQPPLFPSSPLRMIGTGLTLHRRSSNMSRERSAQCLTVLAAQPSHR